MTTLVMKQSSSPDSSCPDCSAFLNWDESRHDYIRETAVVFRSLVATVQFQPSLDDSLEEKAVKFLESVSTRVRSSADAFLVSLGQTTDESSTNFVQSIVVLISSASQVITTATMEILRYLIELCSSKVRLALFKADLLPQLITTLNPHSLSFAEAEDIHIYLMKSILTFLWLATPDSFASLKIKDRDEQLAIHETVFQQVLVPSEQYIWHLCMNCFSIIDGDQSQSERPQNPESLFSSNWSPDGIQSSPQLSTLHLSFSQRQFSRREIFITQQQNSVNVSIALRWERFGKTAAGELDLFGEMHFATKTGSPSTQRRFQKVNRCAPRERDSYRLGHNFELDESVADCTPKKTPKTDAGDTPRLSRRFCVLYSRNESDQY
ncbi:hypothetical protein BLNAU_18561 [Blattamonas nauphoetae]|uniref:Uncharacterized protein n=1 Tax=Blattamonas nauphoetae TaxID=2049346 RepID=A0ABQ9X428_9EUKA|nr:hypothetical protein BLNAU_18561 [Blattamonas nauphoetae]